MPTTAPPTPALDPSAFEAARFPDGMMNSGNTFLVVDGDPKSRFLVREELIATFKGCHVIEAALVEDAIARVKERHPDVVLSDHRVALIDASVLIGDLRGMGFRGPILLLTGSRDPAIHHRAMSAGANRVFFNWETEYVDYLRETLGN